MQRLILTKPSNTPNIAHVYEHVFVAELDKFFNNKKLYRYLDYNIDARAYLSGLIYIEILMYSKEAAQLKDKIEHLKPKIDADAINGAFWQIMAEKKCKIFGSEDTVCQQLKPIDGQAWQLIDSLDESNNLKTKISRADIQFVPSPANNFKNLKLELVLNTKFSKENQALIPLFTVFSYILTDNISVMLSDDFYYFGTGNSYIYNNKMTKEVASFISHKEQNPQLSDELEACVDHIKMMLKDGIVSKLVEALQGATYQVPSNTPDELKIYESTGILIGTKGWKSIATEANLDKIIKNTSLKLTYGKEKQETKIKN